MIAFVILLLDVHALDLDAERDVTDQVIDANDFLPDDVVEVPDHLAYLRWDDQTRLSGSLFDSIAEVLARRDGSLEREARLLIRLIGWKAGRLGERTQGKFTGFLTCDECRALAAMLRRVSPFGAAADDRIADAIRILDYAVAHDRGLVVSAHIPPHLDEDAPPWYQDLDEAGET